MIRTSRFRLETIEPGHATALYPILRDRELYQFIPEEPPEDVEQLTRRYEFLADGRSPDGKESWLNWCVFDEQTGAPIGTVQATVREKEASDLAYIIARDHWRRGVAREAVYSVIRHVFGAYDTPCLAANMDTHNNASEALVRSLGFELVKEIQKAAYFKGRHSDEFRYELTRQRWAKQAPAPRQVTLMGGAP